ncbi:MAG TPA: TlpA disulfide reductase family protein [Bacteroidales bacterium]|nr:TlpA disulfide reductase family protein [Bacteroidales bacterium]
MNKLICLIPLFFLAAACHNNDRGNRSSDNDNTTLITGSLEQGRNQDVYLQTITSRTFVTLDTIKIGDDDSFSTTVRVDYPGYFVLRNEDGKGITFVAVGNDTVNVKGDYHDLRYFTLSGNHDLEQLTLLNKKTQDFLARMDQYARMTNDSISSPNYTNIKLRINEEYKKAFNNLRDYSVNFIRQNQGSLVTLLALSNQLGPRFYVFNPVQDMPLFLSADSALYASYPENDAVLALHNQVITLKNQQVASESGSAGMLSPGDTPPEINLPSPDGKNRALSSTRGKVVLLDFWASWCPPCRRENPNLVENYRKYHSKGFEIYQVSLDKEKQNWVSAIRSDHLDWIHVSDLKYWNSMVVPLYNINSIPTNYLLDRNGKIIAANLRGEALSQKLDDIFNH